MDFLAHHHAYIGRYRYAPHLHSQNVGLLQKLHIYVLHGIEKSSKNGLVVCSFQYHVFWTLFLTLYAQVSLAQRRFQAQNTLWHFTPKGRLFILMLLLLHHGWPSNLKSTPSIQQGEVPPSCNVGNSKKILPLYYLGRAWTFLFSNCSRSNFASFIMELDSNKTNKKGSKETDPTRKVCVKMVEGACCKGPW